MKSNTHGNPKGMGKSRANRHGEVVPGVAGAFGAKKEEA
jgi:hypothetical protein